MNVKKNKIDYLIIITFILTVILLLTIYAYPVFKKPVPIGNDAILHLNSEQWIINNKQVPEPYQPTYHGFYAYTAPLTDINVVLLNQFTQLNITYPLFSYYQLYLILLILLSSFLVGKIYSRPLSIFFPLALITNFSLIRLFVGSTVSNLLAFSYVSIIYYLFYKYIQTKNKSFLWLMIVFFTALFLTHSYLTAPIFAGTFFVYFLFLMMVNKKIRSRIFVILKQIKSIYKILIGTAVLIIGGIITFFYKSVFIEAIAAFWKNPSTNDHFRGAVLIKNYESYLGTFLFTLALLGIIFYIAKWKKNMMTLKSLPVIWFAVLFILLQTYRLGINFYYERIVLLSGVFISFFAAYYIVEIIKNKKLNRKYSLVCVTLIVIIFVITGTNRMKRIYETSNLVKADQIEGLKKLKEITDKDSFIVSNISGVSQTRHDIMISDKDILYASTRADNCAYNNLICQAFNSPGTDSSLAIFKENRIKYFLFMRGNSEGNDKLEKLVQKYEGNKSYGKIFASENMLVFSLLE